MKIPSTLLMVGVLTLPALADARAADVTGTWLTQDERGRIRTERCGPGNADLCGFVVWVRDLNGEDGKPKADVENPDASKRSRPILGHELMTELKPDGDGSFAGQVYNADNGKSYKVSVWSEDAKSLSVKGCLISYLCKTQTWERVADVAPGQLKGAVDAPGGPRRDRSTK